MEFEGEPRLPEREARRCEWDPACSQGPCGLPRGHPPTYDFDLNWDSCSEVAISDLEFISQAFPVPFFFKPLVAEEGGVGFLLLGSSLSPEENSQGGQGAHTASSSGAPGNRGCSLSTNHQVAAGASNLRVGQRNLNILGI